MSVYLSVCMSVCLSVYLSVCMYVCMSVCMYIYVFECMTPNASQGSDVVAQSLAVINGYLESAAKADKKKAPGLGVSVAVVVSSEGIRTIDRSTREVVHNIVIRAISFSTEVRLFVFVFLCALGQSFTLPIATQAGLCCHATHTTQMSWSTHLFIKNPVSNTCLQRRSLGKSLRPLRLSRLTIGVTAKRATHLGTDIISGSRLSSTCVPPRKTKL